jgi:hypothetical protein
MHARPVPVFAPGLILVSEFLDCAPIQIWPVPPKPPQPRRGRGRAGRGAGVGRGAARGRRGGRGGRCGRAVVAGGVAVAPVDAVAGGGLALAVLDAPGGGGGLGGIVGADLADDVGDLVLDFDDDEGACDAPSGEGDSADDEDTQEEYLWP